MTFQPGQSGNPGGRPRGGNEVRELARAKSAQAIEKLAELAESDDNPRVAALACKTLLERAWGRAPVRRPNDPLPSELVAQAHRLSNRTASQQAGG